MAIFKGEYEWRQKCREEYEAKQRAKKAAGDATAARGPAEGEWTDDLESQTILDLRETARDMDIPRYYSLSKAALIEAIRRGS